MRACWTETLKDTRKTIPSKRELFENSARYLKLLNEQIEAIKETIELDTMKVENAGNGAVEALQKLRPKTVHTAPGGNDLLRKEDNGSANATPGEPQAEELKGAMLNALKSKSKNNSSSEEIAFRDAEDFRQLEEGLEIVQDATVEAEKVFITKNEKRCFEDIGQIAARTRAPLDDKHQRYFEKDRKKFANRISMPETQELVKTDAVPPEIISATKETPVNITSTELDGLRSYLLQLKELIARRETAWARTTERDYNQRVEITRFKNEVSHLRMLCEKRQRDIKERDQIIATKEEEIKELQKRVQALKNAVIKLEKKDEKIMDTLDGLTNEVLENSQIIQRSYNVMKRSSMMKAPNSPAPTPSKPAIGGTVIRSKDLRKPKTLPEKSKTKPASSNAMEEVGSRSEHERSKTKRIEGAAIEKVDEKLQRIEEMLHAEVLKSTKKQSQGWKPTGKNQVSNDFKNLIRNQTDKGTGDVDPNFQKKLPPSNSKMRQEMLGAMAGMNASLNLGARSGGFVQDMKKQQCNANLIANALFAARSANMHF